MELNYPRDPWMPRGGREGLIVMPGTRLAPMEAHMKGVKGCPATGQEVRMESFQCRTPSRVGFLMPEMAMGMHNLAAMEGTDQRNPLLRTRWEWHG